MNVDIRNNASTYRSSVYDPSNSNNIKIDINIDDIYVDDSIKSDNSIKLISEINNLDELNDSNESSESSESNESINSKDLNERCNSFSVEGFSSWSEIVDCECNIENKLLVSSMNEDDMMKTKNKEIGYQYSIADILTKKPSSVDDITLLEFETYIASNLKKYIKQFIDLQEKSEKQITFSSEKGTDGTVGYQKLTDIDFKLHMPKFEWLANASSYLANKLSLPIELHKESFIDIEKGHIPRSSYKFCEFNYECEFNYKEKSNGCYAQHFVHNVVHADIVSVICYVNKIYESNMLHKLNITEIYKCITTISFVVKHMTEELSNLKYRHCVGDIKLLNNLHIERSQILKNNTKHNNLNKFNKQNKTNKSIKFKSNKLNKNLKPTN